MAADSLTIEQESYRLELFLSSGAMACHATIMRLDGGVPPTAAELKEVLHSRGIVHGLDEAGIDELVELVSSTSEQSMDICVARGTPPKSIDGRIEFIVQPSRDRPEVNNSQTKNNQVDYRVTNMFQNVYPDQELALIHPGTKQDGMTVTGKTVLATRGHDIYAQAGDGVKKVDNGTRVLATREGRLVYKDDTLQVSVDLVVDFNVDYSVGHIDFVGFVRIGGDVSDGFNIHGKRGVQVDGTVGVCTISSEGDIKLGGMSGGKSTGAIIQCGGNLTSNYLHNVTVDCEKDLTVNYEMLRCRVKCRGAIYVKGNVSGGEYAARNGMDLISIGSDLGIVTKLNAGLVDKEITQKTELGDELKLIVIEMDATVRKLSPLRRRPEVLAGSERLRTMAKALLERYQELVARKAEIEETIKSAEYEALRRINAIKEKANAKINVRSVCYHATVIELDNLIHKCKTDTRGPVSIIKNPEAQDVLYLPMTSLSVNAHQLQKCILSHEAIEPDGSAAAPPGTLSADESV